MAEVARLDILVNTTALGEAEGRLDNLTRTGGRAEAQAIRSTRAFGGLTGAILSLAAALGTVKLIQYADAWARMQGRINLVTASHEEAIAVQERLYQVAQRSRSGLEGTAQLYVRLAQNTKELKLSQEQMLRITETVNKALVIGGAAASEVRGGVLQLSQALASGTLRGDEFRSVLENMPRIAIALTEKLGITRDELYKMAAEGRLSSRTLATTLLAVSKQIDEEFKLLPLTVDGAMVVVHNAMLRYVGTVSQAAGATMTLANTVNSLADLLESPEAFQAGVKFAEALAVGIRMAADAALWMGRNLDLVIGIMKIMLALRLVRFVNDLRLAIIALNTAMSANVFYTLLRVAVALGVALYELSDGFEHWEKVMPRVASGATAILDEISDKLAKIKIESAGAETNLRDMLAIFVAPRRAPGDPSFTGTLMGEEPRYPGVGAAQAKLRTQAANAMSGGGGALPAGFSNSLSAEQKAEVQRTQELIDYLLQSWTDLGNKIGGIWTATGKAITDNTKSVVNTIVGLFMAGIDLMLGGLAALGAFGKGIYDELSRPLAELAKALTSQDWSDPITAITQLGTAIANIKPPDLTKPLAEANATILEAWKAAGEDLNKDYVGEVTAMLKDGAQIATDWAKRVVYDPLVKWIDALGTYFSDVWAGIMRAAALESRRSDPANAFAKRPENVGTPQMIDGSFPPIPLPRPYGLQVGGEDPDAKAKADPFPELKRNLMDQLKAQQRLATAYQEGAGAVAAAERATERYNAVSDLQGKKITPAQRAELTALVNTTYDLKDANVAASQAMQIREGLQRDTERAQLELSTVGDRQSAINTEIRLLEIRNQLQDQGIPDAAKIAESFRTQVEGAERVNAALERQKAAAAAISGVFEQAFDRIGESITEAFTKGESAAINFQSITEGVLSEVMQALIKFTILNPLKNSLFGGNDPTVSDIGGILGDIMGNKPKEPVKPANDITAANGNIDLSKALSNGITATVGTATLSIGSATVNMESVPGSMIPNRPDAPINGSIGTSAPLGGAGADTMADATTKIAANANTFSDTFGGVLGRLANGMAASSNIFVSGFGSVLSAILQGIQAVSKEMGGAGGGGGFFSAVGQFFGSLIGGGASSGTIGTSTSPYIGSSDAAYYHAGGIVGQSARHRNLPMSLFANAPRYHNGGLAGDEMAAVVLRGEEILTRRDPRHRDNAANGNSPGSAAQPVVNNFTVENHTGSEVRQQETRNSSGGVDIVAVIGNAAASELGRRGSPMAKSMQQTYGATPALRGR